MHNFLYLLLEAINFGKKKVPKPKETMSTKVSRNTWRSAMIKKKTKKVIPKKLSLLGGRELIRQTNNTRKVWDPKGYRAQKFYDNVYKTL